MRSPPDDEEFRRAIAGVEPLPPTRRVSLPPSKPAPGAKQRQRDERAALAESLRGPVSLDDALESGEELAFLRDGLVDEVLVHLAPTFLGAGPSLVGDLGISTMADALSLRIVDLLPMGGDVQIRLRPTRHTGGDTHADGRG